MTPKRAEVYERLGIPTVATVPWTTSRLLKTVLGETTAEAWRDPSGAVALLHVTPNEGWVGHRLTDFEAASGARAALVTRFGTGQLPLPSTLIQSGDTLHVLTTDDQIDLLQAGHRAATERTHGMKVAIAGAGAVGRSIARELLANGHDVLLIDKDPTKIIEQRVPGADLAAGRRLRGRQPRAGRPGRLRGRRRRHRRRQGQPGHLAAGQDRVLGPPGRRPDQPPGQRMAVHRGLGRRRRRVDAAGAGRAGRGGGDGRRPRAAVHASARARPT